MSNASSAIATYAKRLGDDSLILSQRLSEWCGHAPTIEVDLSLTNLALDLVGQATLLLGLAAEAEGKGEDADTLAFRRDALDFCNCLIVEQPNGDFAQTIARQFLFSAYQNLLFDALAASKNPTLAAIAAKAKKETTYHAHLAEDWVIRLGDGTDESRARMVEGLAWMWRFVDEMFDMDEIETELAKAGVGVDKAKLRGAWDARINAALAKAGLERPAPHRAIRGGRGGHHSEHLGHMLSEMQFLQRAYPNAIW